MKDQKNKDLETISLFLILGVLTVTLGFIIKLVLFGPEISQPGLPASLNKLLQLILSQFQ